MMSGNVYVYILVMALVTYLIRALPLTLIRREIRSRFLRSFLYYVPYVALASMTFPAILYSTGSLITALAGFAAAVAMAWRGKGLLPVACVACGAVLAAELIVQAIPGLS